MRVLVTGCNGYIGSHVCKILNERGHIIDGTVSYTHLRAHET